ncbi:MAG: hypothetical protein ABIH23_06815 [bacterium]
MIIHPGDSEWETYATAFAPDGNRLITGGSSLTLWDLETGQRLQVFEDDSISGPILFSPDGKIAAVAYINAGGWVFRVKLWDLTAGKSIHKLEYSIARIDRYYPNTWWVAMAFSPDGKRLLTGDVTSKLALWDTSTGDMVWQYWVYGRARGILAGKLSFVLDGKGAIVHCGGVHVYLVDLEKAEVVYDMFACCFSVSSDGAQLLINGDGSIRLHNSATGDLIRSFPSEIVEYKQRMVLSPYGNLAIVNPPYRQEHIYPRRIVDMNTGEVLRTYSPDSDTLYEFSPDGKRFLTANGTSREIHIWDISDLQSAVQEASLYD